jgi:hypothetical protein
MANQPNQLDGERLNNVFAMDILGDKDLNMTPIIAHVPLRETPSDLAFTTGVNDSVTEQGHRVSCSIDNNGNLSIAPDVNGSGIILPYIGGGAGANAPIGVAVTPGRGLGTYTPPIQVGGAVSWVCTGKFSGCSSYSIRSHANGNGAVPPLHLVFGHLITPSAGYTADTVPNQAANILAQTGYDPATVDQHRVTPINVNGSDGGYVFWMETVNGWVRRQVWMLGSTIKVIENPNFVP